MVQGVGPDGSGSPFELYESDSPGPIGDTPFVPSPWPAISTCPFSHPTCSFSNEGLSGYVWLSSAVLSLASPSVVVLEVGSVHWAFGLMRGPLLAARFFRVLGLQCPSTAAPRSPAVALQLVAAASVIIEVGP